MQYMECRDFAVILLIFSKPHRDFAYFCRDFNTSLIVHGPIIPRPQP